MLVDLKVLVPKEEYERRIKICRGCKFYKKLFTECKVCHCIMTVKARIAGCYCPVGKWTAWKEEKSN